MLRQDAQDRYWRTKHPFHLDDKSLVMISVNPNATNNLKRCEEAVSPSAL
jgi:hypothetical protein